jgi:hypothetical protein
MARYDLRKEAEGYKSFVRKSRWIVAGGVGFGGLFAAYFGVRILVEGYPTASFVIGFGFGLFLTGITGVILWALGPSAEYAEIDENQVAFLYHGGKVKRLSWTDPKFKLIIDQTTGNPDPISKGDALQAAADRRVFQNFLSLGAFQSILEEARRHGLSISERPSPRRGWTRITITRISV